MIVFIATNAFLTVIDKQRENPQSGHLNLEKF